MKLLLTNEEVEQITRQVSVYKLRNWILPDTTNTIECAMATIRVKTAQIEVLALALETTLAAVEEVLTHRRADQDSNYVLWIGEGTFIRCEAAAKSARELFPKENKT